jgi:hypothetical protein
MVHIVWAVPCRVPCREGDIMLSQIMEDLLWQYLQKGDLTGFINAVYMNIMGEAWFVIPYFTIFALLYVKTESLAYCAIVWILLSGVLLYAFPAEAATVAGLFLVLAVGVILFRVAMHFFSRLSI